MAKPLESLSPPPWRRAPVASPVSLHASLSAETTMVAVGLAQAEEVEAVGVRFARWGVALVVPPNLEAAREWVGRFILARLVVTRLVLADLDRLGVLPPDTAFGVEEAARRCAMGRRGWWTTVVLSRERLPDVARRRGGLTYSEYVAHVILGEARGRSTGGS